MLDHDAWRRLAEPDAAPLLAAAADATPGDVAAIARLRKRGDPETVRAALLLAEARRKLARKWPDRPGLFADPEGAEMASGALAARHKAARFARALPAASVADLCCGVGADAVALAEAGLRVVAIDRDPVRAWMAGLNAGCETAACDVESIDLDAFDALHLDPSRRDETGRRIRYDQLTPGPAFIERAVAGRAACVKLPPGVNPGEPPEGELEYISERGTMTQAVLWTGPLATSPVSAVSLDDGRPAASIAGEPEPDAACPFARVDDAAWVHTADPCVERAGLLPALCARTGLGLAHPGTGLLCGHAAATDPLLIPFRVREVMPWRRERVRARLAELGAGVVEVKTRGKAADTDAEQKALRGGGDAPMVVFVLRFGQAVRAIIAERPSPPQA